MAHSPSLLTRSASLTGYLDLARTLGLDPYRMAVTHGVPPASLTDPDLMVPANAVGRLLEASAQRAGALDIGLRMAETRNLSNLGAMGLVAREQPTLRKALEAMINYMWSQNQAQTLRLEEAGEVAVLRSSLAGPRPDASRQSNELTVAVMLRTLRRLLGQSWRPEAVAFTHAAPPDLTTHRRVLGMTPMFAQPFNGLVIAVSDLEAPVIDSDPVAARRIERYIEQVEGRRKADPVAAARELIVALLPTGACSVERVARHMGVDRRTLHRWLAQGGYSFVNLLAEVRENLAAAHLGAQDRSLTEIADRLGYASLSAFSRWYQRRFGVPPSTARARSGANTP